MFLGWKTRFPHENNAILHSFFQGVFHASFGLVFEVFWGLPGDPPGLGVFGGFLGGLGSLVGPIWASVGWLCAFLEALWRKSGRLRLTWGQIWLLLGSWFANQVFLPYLWMPLVEFVGIGEAGLDLCQCVSIGAELHKKLNAQLTCTCAHCDPSHDMRACCNKLLKAIRFESDNGRFNEIWLQYIH